MQFADRELLLPITTERAWQGWDTAVSIVGHDLEVKQTYAYLLASRERPDLFVDIGANYGTHSLLFLVHGIKAITFEPNSSCHEYFRETCSLNDVDYCLEPVALGDTNGVVEIGYPERDTWFGSTDPSIQRDLAEKRELIVERVPQRRLDDYLAKLQARRMLIKIDTEGNEYRVLQGAVNTLNKCRPLIIFESWKDERRSQLYDFFAAHSYEIKALPWEPSTRAPSLSRAEFSDKRAPNYIAVAQR